MKAGHVAMEETIKKAPRSALRSLLLCGAKIHHHCFPFSEADQTSHLILGMLSHVMDRPDETKGFDAADEYLPTLAIIDRWFFRLKDQGDLARTLIRSKRAADEIATTFVGVEGMDILFV